METMSGKPMPKIDMNLSSMNLETKLENELPWSPKFRDTFPIKEECYAGKGSIAYTYRRKDTKHCVFIKTAIDSRDSLKVEYWIQENPTADTFAMMRIGGPSSYHYTDGQLRSLRFALFGKIKKPTQYWDALCALKYYKKKQTGDKVFYFPRVKGAICPDHYSIRQKRLVYKLKGKRVTMRRFYLHHETRFVGIDFQSKELI